VRQRIGCANRCAVGFANFSGARTSRAPAVTGGEGACRVRDVFVDLREGGRPVRNVG
jgi:hypothetical protein